MGIEYELRFPADPNKVDNELRVLRFFSRFDSGTGQYYFSCGQHTGDNQSVDAIATVTPTGLYFCDIAITDASARLFRAIIDLALQFADIVEIFEP